MKSRWTCSNWQDKTWWVPRGVCNASRPSTATLPRDLRSTQRLGLRHRRSFSEIGLNSLPPGSCQLINMIVRLSKRLSKCEKIFNEKEHLPESVDAASVLIKHRFFANLAHFCVVTSFYSLWKKNDPCPHQKPKSVDELQNLIKFWASLTKKLFSYVFKQIQEPGRETKISQK